MLSINVVVPPWNYWNNPLKIQPLWELYYATLFQTKFPTAKVTITDLREPLTSTASFSLPESEIYFYWIMKSADAAEIYSLVEKLKAAYPKSIHIAGGTHVEHCSKECEKIFDSLCFGTGEELLIEALNDFQNGKLRQLYKTHEVYPFENYSHPLRDFLPDHRIVNKEHFSQYGDFIGTTAYFSRGCSFSCNFCIYNFPRTFDYRKHNQITEEIEYLKERYKIDAINIKDEVCIPPNINLCREYLEAIGKSNIKWRGQTIPAGSEEMIKLARESGCLELALGIESVENDKVLKLSNKPAPDVSKNRKFIETVKKHGIRVKICLVFGLPGETKNVLEKTIQYIEEVQPDFVSVSGFDPIPGSYFYKNPKEFGIKSIDPDLSKHAHLLFRFGNNEEVGLPFEFHEQTPWGPSLTREDISNNIRSLQRYLGEHNMVY